MAKKVNNEVEKNLVKDRLMMQQSRLAQMGEAISMIAHQWRQPLNTLSLVTQSIYLKFMMGKLDSKDMEKFQVSSQKQIKQMSDTIDDFRDFFRPEKNKTIFAIDKPINHVLTILEHMLKQELIDVKLDIKDELYINGYPNELGQVLINIINNAKDAFIDGISKEQRIIKISTYIDDSIVYITIEDNAGGIPLDVIDSIFDPYFSTKTQKNGTGLGLYMSKIIIQQHMLGSLNVINITNGAKFVLSFKEVTDNK